MTSESQIARFAVGDTVTVLVGSRTGDHAFVEHVVWSERDRCHYFYLEQRSPVRKLSRGYRAHELAGGHIELAASAIETPGAKLPGGSGEPPGETSGDPGETH